MGAVYLAARADDEYQKQVAVKIIKRGLDTDEVRRRFRNERQILARLEHPNIARLLDGGTTEDGLSYFVMEYVEGQALNEYSDGHKLLTAERLKLFRTICSAVVYAHQNLVVHRDLKPSNILVTADGTPKLLDFGIAKLLHGDGQPEADPVTVTALRVLTPEYASPEQIRGLPATTATDVYSLGVVLYELLTGHRPHRLQSRNPAEIARVICEEEPVRPSESIAARRLRIAEAKHTSSNSEPAFHNWQSLRGDLDNIVLMAMRKEPARRYSSVAQLSDDVRRHLEGLPVSARKDTFTYRASKFVRRHRAGAATILLVGLSLIVGIVATAWQARRAERERARAEQRFNDVRRLANSFMFEFHDAIQNLPGSTPARELVVSRALEYLDSLASEAGDDPALRRELATAYRKLGNVQGNPAVPNLGDTAGAIASYRKALQIREALVASTPEARREMADLLNGFGDLLWWAGDLAGASTAYRRALSLREELLAGDEENSALRHEVAASRLGLAQVHFWNSETAAALEENYRALAMLEGLVARHPQSIEYRRDVGVAYTRIGDTLFWDGKSDQAHENLRRAISILEPLAREHPADARLSRHLMTAYTKLGDSFNETNMAEATAAYRRALSINEAIERADPLDAQARRNTATLLGKIGEVFIHEKRIPEAIEKFRRSLSIRERLAADNPRNATAREDLSNAYVQIGQALESRNDLAGALENYHRALDLREVLVGEDPHNAATRSYVADVKLYIADAHARAARWREARSWYEQSLSGWRELLNQGQLGGANTDKLEAAARGLARSDAALAGL